MKSPQGLYWLMTKNEDGTALLNVYYTYNKSVSSYIDMSLIKMVDDNSYGYTRHSYLKLQLSRKIHPSSVCEHQHPQRYHGEISIGHPPCQIYVCRWYPFLHINKPSHQVHRGPDDQISTHQNRNLNYQISQGMLC